MESGLAINVPETTDIRGGCTLALRPEDIELLPESAAGLEAEVEVGIFLGNVIDYRIRIGDTRLRVQSTVTTMFKPGDKVRVKVSRAVLFN
jgi:ABC-type Fe3+/spermidine/putrescine transport system ATPase subunit